MSKYVGITVGPIYDTILEASTPAALWFASSMFSDITKRICKAVTEEKCILNVKLLSPYFAPEIRENDGVGKYYDRIIFSFESLDEQILKNIIRIVKKETKNIFPRFIQKDAEDFLESYLQIHYVILDSSKVQGNIILELSRYLDMLELMRSFPKENTLNPIRKLFQGEDNNGNKYIKQCELFTQIKAESNQLKKNNDQIWRIEEIASCHGKASADFKKTYYYAVVKADGDNMGEFLKLLSDNEVTELSRCCMTYDEKAADLIGKFGGMTVYAGGDDLLFLAPLENAEGYTIFDLCQDIRVQFENTLKSTDSFAKKKILPTLSFGISMQYSKFPLYEAHKNSGKLLRQAKYETAAKNSMAIGLQKHSGRSFGVLVSNMDFKVFQQGLAIGKEMTKPEETLTSVIQTLETYHSLLRIMNREARAGQMSREQYECAFMNLFDNVEQKPAENYLKAVCAYYYDNFVVQSAKISLTADAQKSDERFEEESLNVLLYILHIKKFFCEKGAVQ